MKIAVALMMEAARTSETLVNFYQTTRCYNPEESNLSTRLHGATSQNTVIFILMNMFTRNQYVIES
jgi:hypothetical protein